MKPSLWTSLLALHGHIDPRWLAAKPTTSRHKPDDAARLSHSAMHDLEAPAAALAAIADPAGEGTAADPDAGGKRIEAAAAGRPAERQRTACAFLNKISAWIDRGG